MHTRNVTVYYREVARNESNTPSMKFPWLVDIIWNFSISKIDYFQRNGGIAVWTNIISFLAHGANNYPFTDSTARLGKLKFLSHPDYLFISSPGKLYSAPPLKKVLALSFRSKCLLMLRLKLRAAFFLPGRSLNETAACLLPSVSYYVPRAELRSTRDSSVSGYFIEQVNNEKFVWKTGSFVL